MLNKKVKDKKFLPIAIGLLVVILLIVLAFVLFSNRNKDDSQSQAETTRSSKDILADKDETSDNNKPADTDKDNDANSVDTRNPSDIPASNSVALQLSDFRQANGVVYSSIAITGSTASGKCVFNYTSDQSRPVVQEVVSTESQCVSNIPEVRFDKLGEWKLSVTFYAQNAKSEFSQNVTIK